jgi:hypothetical protein
LPPCELEIGNLLVQQLTCLLCFVVLIFVVLSLEFAIELRGELLVDVTTSSLSSPSAPYQVSQHHRAQNVLREFAPLIRRLVR